MSEASDATVAGRERDDRLERQRALRRALDRGDVVLEYRPVVADPPERIVGFEALVRWQHPERGLLEPLELIAFAEETELIGELSRQVLAAACAQTRRWQLRHPDLSPLSVRVSVSPQQLQTDELVEDVEISLRSSGLPAASLVLELTETSLAPGIDATAAHRAALEALGVQLAVAGSRTPPTTPGDRPAEDAAAIDDLLARAPRSA